MKKKKPQNINMGQRFRDAREAKGWSREKLAEEVGLSVPFIADLELGNSGLSLDSFMKLCQVLNADAHTILFGNVEENPALFNLGTMLANRDTKDVHRVVAMLEAITEAYFEN